MFWYDIANCKTVWNWDALACVIPHLPHNQLTNIWEADMEREFELLLQNTQAESADIFTCVV